MAFRPLHDRIVVRRIEAEEKIRSMARYDSLTGLPNRAYFHELVAEAMAGGDRERQCGLVVLDLDDFKSVNDTLGHPIGDGLLYAVGEKLSAIATGNVWVSRFGGDEFMIYVDRVEAEDDFLRLVDSVFDGLQGEVDVAGHSLRIQISAGAVLSREKLEESVYGWGGEVGSNAIEVHLHHLRKKLGSASIKNVRGVGYRMAED